MERIEQYGLQWIVQGTTGNYVFLKQGNGLIFSGLIMSIYSGDHVLMCLDFT